MAWKCLKDVLCVVLSAIGYPGHPCFTSGCYNLIIREMLSNVHVLRFEVCALPIGRPRNLGTVAGSQIFFCFLWYFYVVQPEIDEELIDFASCRVSLTLHLKCVPYQHCECFNQWSYHTIALSFKLICHGTTVVARGFKVAKPSLMLIWNARFNWLFFCWWWSHEGGYRRASLRVRIVIVWQWLGIISTLLLVLDNLFSCTKLFYDNFLEALK